MTVYILFVHYTYIQDGDYSCEFIGAYKDFEEAQKHMLEEIESARVDFQSYDTEEEPYIEGNMCWSIWEKGYQVSHNTTIIINECEPK